MRASARNVVACSSRPARSFTPIALDDTVKLCVQSLDVKVVIRNVTSDERDEWVLRGVAVARLAALAEATADARRLLPRLLPRAQRLQMADELPLGVGVGVAETVEVDAIFPPDTRGDSADSRESQRGAAEAVLRQLALLCGLRHQLPPEQQPGCSVTHATDCAKDPGLAAGPASAEVASAVTDAARADADAADDDDDDTSAAGAAAGSLPRGGQQISSRSAASAHVTLVEAAVAELLHFIGVDPVSGRRTLALGDFLAGRPQAPAATLAELAALEVFRCAALRCAATALHPAFSRSLPRSDEESDGSVSVCDESTVFGDDCGDDGAAEWTGNQLPPTDFADASATSGRAGLEDFAWVDAGSVECSGGAAEAGGEAGKLSAAKRAAACAADRQEDAAGGADGKADSSKAESASLDSWVILGSDDEDGNSAAGEPATEAT